MSSPASSNCSEFRFPGPPPKSVMNVLTPMMHAVSGELGVAAAKAHIQISHAQFGVLVEHVMAAGIAGAHMALREHKALMQDDAVPVWLGT